MRPYYRKDIDLIERRASKLIPQLKDKSYEERLIFLELTTLETRRLRGDLIEVFKIFKGYDDLKPSKFLNLNTNLTRGHSLKLFKGRFNLDCRKFFFSRVIDVWNSLVEDIIA